MSTISFDISDLPDWADKKPGDTCEACVTLTVTTNDGKTLAGEVTDAEACDDGESEAEPSGDSEDMPMDGMHEGKPRPTAVIAIGIKPAK
jgi:hypothetical protein